uniref:Uncharacterized protein n=1 Tax=Leersia perrieri TaxID=77586 RepID=A0A0D9V986_9ORYZ
MCLQDPVAIGVGHHCLPLPWCASLLVVVAFEDESTYHRLTRVQARGRIQPIHPTAHSPQAAPSHQTNPTAPHPPLHTETKEDATLPSSAAAAAAPPSFPRSLPLSSPTAADRPPPPPSLFPFLAEAAGPPSPPPLFPSAAEAEAEAAAAMRRGGRDPRPDGGGGPSTATGDPGWPIHHIHYFLIVGLVNPSFAKYNDYDPYEENPGTAPFSEPEAQIMRELSKSFKPHMWVNVQSGLEALFMPNDHKNTTPNGASAHLMRFQVAKSGVKKKKKLTRCGSNPSFVVKEPLGPLLIPDGTNGHIPYKGSIQT